MGKYLDGLEDSKKEYFKTLSSEFPEFLLDYINTPRMQKQSFVSVSCGTYYSKMFPNVWFSSLDHSIAVALIIWNFTHDKKMTLSGLFHDISTPAFKHCIDFLNNDYETQESTEDLTRTMIIESKEIMSLLNRDKISIHEVSNYHLYPIADNDTPMLSADRLEYTLSNALGLIKKIWDLDEVRKIYSNIKIIIKKNGIPEMCFQDKEIAERFVEVMSELSLAYMSDKRRFGMQFLADIIKLMSEEGIVSITDLYELGEKDIIEIIQNCSIGNIAQCFKIWQNARDIKISDKRINDKYCVNIRAKKRYINPLVATEEGSFRIGDLSDKARKNIEKCLNYTFDRYLYMDFLLEDKERVLSKKK